MKPEQSSITLLGVARSKAKMYEYAVPQADHIQVPKDPARLLRLSIGILGDYCVMDNQPDEDPQTLAELRKTLFFSAQYFDSYLKSQLNEELDSYLLLMGAASYYLCDFPGSASVLLKSVSSDIDLECEGLEQLLLWLLLNDYEALIQITSAKYTRWIDTIYFLLGEFLRTGENVNFISENSATLRRYVYKHGTDRELLITDIICAVIKKRIRNSSWLALPQYSAVPENAWREVILKRTSIKEFWPAQRLLGEKGIFNGSSAIVQMPTSAGKTKSIEIIIRSSFLSGRAKMAIIVVPFKALCSEIKRTLEEAFEGEPIDIDLPSDTFQRDFANLEALDSQANPLILIATPEKLLYILRQTPSIAKETGLLIFDEGHQFDAGLRGVTYELLLSSLKSMINKNIQIVLISAVISNAEAIGQWLIGDNGEIVSGINLSPTYRTVAFTSWTDTRGRMEFVDPSNIDRWEYYVPRVIEQVPLQKRGRETKDRFFPDKTDDQSIALYLGLKLMRNGAIAIFCGNKQSVIGMCDTINDLSARGYQTEWPRMYSAETEIRALQLLHERHFGADYTTTKSAGLGVFAHSANTPQGIRSAIEYAMQQNQIKFVICTSTLAQGVNLPIKYLIVSSVYQAGQRIKTRDFHNLIGRAGRAGMHTEGSILFADPGLFDRRIFKDSEWRWKEVKHLLDTSKSEPCASTLASLFTPLYSDKSREQLTFFAVRFVAMYLNSRTSLDDAASSLSEEFGSTIYTKQGLLRQLQVKAKIIDAIESYLMSYQEEGDFTDEDVEKLAKETLAYFLASEVQKKELLEVFSLLRKHVIETFREPTKRRAYGKTLFGVRDVVDIENWVKDNLYPVEEAIPSDVLLEIIWPLLLNKISHDGFQKITPNSSLILLARTWIEGAPHVKLHRLLQSIDTRFFYGEQRRKLKMEVVVDICENAFAFDGTLLIASIVEVLLNNERPGQEALIEQLNLLQKRLKYGLSSKLAITFYEAGFSDRYIAGMLAATFSDFGTTRRELVRDIKRMENELRKALSEYPAYFMHILNNLLSK